MRRTILRFALWGLAVLALAGALADPAAAQKESKAIAEVRKLNEENIAAFIARDLDKTMSFYWNSPDLFTVGEGGQVTKGWEEARKSSQSFFASVESVSLSCGQWQYVASGDGVLGSCPYKIGFKLKGGPQVNSEGWYTNFWRKIGGKWVIVFEQVAQNTPAPPGPTTSLYKRLGGYDALAAVSDDFLGRLASDKQLGRFFQGVSKAHVQSIRQHIVDFLCMATGGPCIYVGRDMKSTHTGLGITGADWDRMVVLLVQTFDKFGVPERERKDVLGALGGLKGDIVDKP